MTTKDFEFFAEAALILMGVYFLLRIIGVIV